MQTKTLLKSLIVGKPSNPCMHGQADARQSGHFEWTLNDDDDDDDDDDGDGDGDGDDDDDDDDDEIFQREKQVLTSQ